MTQPTVAFVGNTRVAWTTETHLQRTLRGLGWRVLPIQEDETTPAGIYETAMNANASVVWYQRTWGYPNPDDLIDVWRRLEANGVTTVSLHLDLYLGLKRADTLDGDPFWSTQHVFTPDGDPASQAEFERRGINHHYLPPAVVADECYPGTRRERYAHDVVFVGSETYHPEYPYRGELIARLREWYGPRFVRYGAGTEVVRDANLNDLYASARVVVGDSLCPGFTKPAYWSDRPYETVGRCGYLVMPHVPGLEAHFTDGEHLRFYRYGDWGQLHDTIERSLADPIGRDTVRRRGMEHVRANHTYTNRLTDALRIMGLEAR